MRAHIANTGTTLITGVDLSFGFLCEAFGVERRIVVAFQNCACRRCGRRNFNGKIKSVVVVANNPFFVI